MVYSDTVFFFPPPAPSLPLTTLLCSLIADTVFFFLMFLFQILSLAIKQLYSIDQLVPLLHEIGVKHCKYAYRGFEPEHWDVFLVINQFLSTNKRFFFPCFFYAY